MRFLQSTKLVASLLAVLAMLATSLSVAKSINLYDQPNAGSKVVGTLESSNGMVPIFTPDKSEWMKVGDPKNGNVGWINVNDLSDQNGVSGTAFSMTQKTIDTKSGPKTVQVVQFSTPKPLSPAESLALQKEIKTRQENLQKSIQKLMSDVYSQMSAYYMENPALYGSPNMPIMPIVVYPQAEQTTPSKGNASQPSLLPIQPLPQKKS